MYCLWYYNTNATIAYDKLLLLCLQYSGSQIMNEAIFLLRLASNKDALDLNMSKKLELFKAMRFRKWLTYVLDLSNYPLTFLRLFDRRWTGCIVI